MQIENEIFLFGRAGSPGCYTNVKACAFAEAAQLHNLPNCGTAGILHAQLTGPFYGYAAEMTGSVCLKG